MCGAVKWHCCIFLQLNSGLPTLLILRFCLLPAVALITFDTQEAAIAASNCASHALGPQNHTVIVKIAKNQIFSNPSTNANTSPFLAHSLSGVGYANPQSDSNPSQGYANPSQGYASPSVGNLNSDLQSDSTENQQDKQVLVSGIPLHISVGIVNNCNVSLKAYLKFLKKQMDWWSCYPSTFVFWKALHYLLSLFLFCHSSSSSSCCRSSSSSSSYNSSSSCCCSSYSFFLFLCPIIIALLFLLLLCPISITLLFLLPLVHLTSSSQCRWG